MSRLWARIIKDHRIDSQDTRPCEWGGEADALTELCKSFDIPRPIWLPKHEREYASFRRTAFLPEHFVEEVDFDYMEVSYIFPEDEKKQARRRHVLEDV